jgi:hypothetical protein
MPLPFSTSVDETPSAILDRVLVTSVALRAMGALQLIPEISKKHVLQLNRKTPILFYHFYLFFSTDTCLLPILLHTCNAYKSRDMKFIPYNCAKSTFSFLRTCVLLSILRHSVLATKCARKRPALKSVPVSHVGFEVPRYLLNVITVIFLCLCASRNF